MELNEHVVFGLDFFALKMEQVKNKLPAYRRVAGNEVCMTSAHADRESHYSLSLCVFIASARG
jgi:hypothetical protein